MPEKYSVSEAARKIGISRRAFYNWLAQEPVATQQVQGDRTFTRIQLERLAEKHGRTLQNDYRDLEAVDSALSEQIEELKVSMMRLEARVNVLEAVRVSIMPRSNASARASASTRANRPISASAVTKAEAARIISERHGVTFGTARLWPWDDSALAGGEEAALLWALDYVRGVAPHKRPDGWRWRCDVASCPCQTITSIEE